MSTSLMYHTQGIRGFQHHSFIYEPDCMVQHIKRKRFHCELCRNGKVTAKPNRIRRVKGLRYGSKNVYFEFEVHYIYCLKCKKRTTEKFPFLSHPKARISKILERSIIELATMDMSKAYISWMNENLPGVEIVFDHFHVIKLMNDKLDKVRRRITAKLDDDQKKLLKNQRFLFLRNVEKLEPDAKLLLDNLRKVFNELGDASMLKEALRSIYKEADDDFTAEAALNNWIVIARETKVPELEQMANTIEKHLKGITAYWRSDKL